MTDSETTGQSNPESEERIPTMQKLLDNPFLLLFLGVVIPTVLYLIWGVMEIITIPIAK
jgi:flagellar biogenesis protein FliO